MSTNAANLLFGKIHLGILHAFFGNPAASYYLRELAKQMGASPGTLKREIDKYVAAGLLERHVQGTQIRYRANERSPIFPELRGIVTKTSASPDVLRDVLLPLEKSISLAFIFGSIARGEATAESDVDLLVIGDVSLRSVLRHLADAQKRIGREINPSVYSVEEFQNKWQRKDPFIREVGAGPKIFLLGGDDELGELRAG